VTTAGIAAQDYAELPTVLDVPAAAAVLGCGERAVRDLIARGELRSVRLGRLIRIPRHALVAFLAGETADQRERSEP
jgi:excisionase family DNA binding protein